MADGEDDLIAEHLMELGKLLAEIVFEIDRIDPGLCKIAGEENLARLFDDRNRIIPQRNRLRGQVLKAFAAKTGFGQLVDYLVQVLPAAIQVNRRILTIVEIFFIGHNSYSPARLYAAVQVSRYCGRIDSFKIISFARSPENSTLH